MNRFVSDLVALQRVFGLMEREAICCGTVSVPQCVVLQELIDGPRDITRLARTMAVNNSSMTRLVDGLERRGWVDRIRAADDRRRVDVSLTTTGEEEATRLSRETTRLVEQTLLKIPKEKRAQVQEALALLRQALEGIRCC